MASRKPAGPKVSLRNSKNEVEKEVECDIVGILGFDLAVHQDDSGQWQITEPQTGYKFCGPCVTRAAALSVAREIIKTRGAENVTDIINRIVEKRDGKH